MPYIAQSARERLTPYLVDLERKVFSTSDLAYVVFYLLHRLYARRPGFATWAALRGTIDDQVDEFRRRVVAPYEDQKREENGDVF